MSTSGWIFMIGFRVLDVGLLVVWLVWFFRLRDDDDSDGGGGPGGEGPEPKPGELTLPRILSTVVDAYGVEQVRDGKLVVRLEKARKGH